MANGKRETKTHLGPRSLKSKAMRVMVLEVGHRLSPLSISLCVKIPQLRGKACWKHTQKPVEAERGPMITIAKDRVRKLAKWSRPNISAINFLGNSLAEQAPKVRMQNKKASTCQERTST